VENFLVKKVGVGERKGKEKGVWSLRK